MIVLTTTNRTGQSRGKSLLKGRQLTEAEQKQQSRKKDDPEVVTPNHEATVDLHAAFDQYLGEVDLELTYHESVGMPHE